MSVELSVILSTGIGRLHLVQSAEHLFRAGVRVTLIQGWVPANEKSLLVRLATAITGHRSLAAGLAKRRVLFPTDSVKTCALADFLTNGLMLFGKWTHLLNRSTAASFGWQFFGRQSSRYLRQKADVFHVRSGAGQGGAIKAARRSGMAVLVDQSSLHPETMQANTDAAYQRWGMPGIVQSDEGIWPLVVQDCRDADLILVNSDNVKKSFVSRGFDENRFAVVYLGVRNDFMGIKKKYGGNDRLRLLFTGGFTPLKGAEFLLESIAILKKRGVECVLDVVGSTEQSQPIIRAYETQGLPVHFHGHVPQVELKAYLAEADVYVFPSLADGCASSGMEALAAGLCVVATPESGLPIYDGKTGFFVEPRNAVALADRLQWLANNRGAIEVCGRAATAYMRDNHSWEKYAEKMMDAYRICMQKRVERLNSEKPRA